MNKAELIDALSDKSNLTKADAGRVLDALVDTVMAAVAAGDSVALIGFGSFKAVRRPAREGRNPATGEPIQIPESTVPKFQPGAVFRSRVENSGKE